MTCYTHWQVTTPHFHAGKVIKSIHTDTQLIRHALLQPLSPAWLSSGVQCVTGEYRELSPRGLNILASLLGNDAGLDRAWTIVLLIIA